MLKRILPFMLVLSIQGCVLSTVVQDQFFGTLGHPPESPGRFTTGLFLAPIVVVLDAVTSPVQLLILALFGDQTFPNIYSVGIQTPENNVCLTPEEASKRIDLALKSNLLHQSRI